MGFFDGLRREKNTAETIKTQQTEISEQMETTIQEEVLQEEISARQVIESYQYQPEVIQMAPGDTLWAISEKYYPQNEDGACFDDFNTRLCDENKALWANGRVPQPGDKVIIPLRKKVENDD